MRRGCRRLQLRHPDNDGDGEPAIGCGGSDCDDDDGARYPGNVEVCDAVDQDCDPNTLAGEDGDADGDGFVSAMCCDGERCGDDCADDDPAVRPDAREQCNAIDDDCSGRADDPGPEDLLCPGGVCAAGRCLFTAWDRLFVPDEFRLTYVSDVDYDEEGNLYAVGDFSTGVDFGDGLAVDHGWATSFAPDGRLRWVQAATGLATGARVVVDSAADRVYVTGGGEADSTELAGTAIGRGGFLAVLSTAGDLLGVRPLPRSFPLPVLALPGGIGVVGTNAEGFDFVSGDTPLRGSRDLYLSEYDTDGAHRSLVSFGAPGATLSLDDAEVLDSGEIALVFDATGPFEWDGTNRTGDWTIVTAMERDGSVRWSRAAERDGIVGVGVQENAHDAERLYLTGSVVRPHDLGGGPFGPAGSDPEQCYLVALERADGDFVWQRVFAGFPAAADARCRSARLDIREDGSLVMAGEFSGTLQVGSGGVAALGAFDIFLASFAPDNVLLRDRVIGGGGEQVLSSVTTGPGGSIVLSGATFGVVDFGSGPRSAGDMVAGFLARITD